LAYREDGGAKTDHVGHHFVHGQDWQGLWWCVYSGSTKRLCVWCGECKGVREKGELREG
jgi:hypothetical protein